MSSSRFIAATILRSTCPPLKAIFQHHIPRYQRSFSLTPQRRTAENLANFQAAFQKTTVFKKLANHPEALSALQDLAQALEKGGVDLAGGKTPSTLKMMKIAASSDFREAIRRVTEEMGKAGVDFNSKEIMDEITSLQKAMGSSK